MWENCVCVCVHVFVSAEKVRECVFHNERKRSKMLLLFVFVDVTGMKTYTA